MTSAAPPPAGPDRGPTLTGLVFMIWVIAGAAFAARALNADGDIARHLAHGQWMLEHGGVIRFDPFSFTRAGTPFTGFEYGSQMLLALAERLGGIPLVAVLGAAAWAGALALVTRFMLRRGADAGLTYLVVTLAAVISSFHYAVRPHLVTQLLAVVLLDRLDHETAPPWWWCAGLFVVWANLHGGWLFGLILMGVFLAADVLRGWWGARESPARRRARGIAIGMAVGLAATCLNPYGWHLTTHVLGFMGEGFIQRQTSEFMSPDFHGLNARIWLLALLGVLTIYAVRRERPRLDHLLVVLALTAFALMARRNMALWGLVALPLAALHFDPLWRALPEPPGFRASFARAAARRWRPMWWGVPLVALVALALAGGRLAGRQLLPAGFDATKFPVETVAWAQAEGIGGRIYNDFVWGGWMLGAWPEQPVFIDGGTDHYGEELMRDYLDVLTLQRNWREVLDEWEIDLALIPARGPLASQLAREPGWQELRRDTLAVLLGRQGESAVGQ